MASHSLLPYLLPLLASLLSVKASVIYPLDCSAQVKTCNALIYHINNSLSVEEIAFFYSVQISQMKPILHGYKQDYLINVPCSCTNADGATGLFYKTSYHVEQGDTFDSVSSNIYSEQAWSNGGNGSKQIRDPDIPIYLPCGCVEDTSQTVVTYTVQAHDTLSGIALLLSAEKSDIQRLNRNFTKDPSFIEPGWVLFVPMDNKGKTKKWKIIIGTLSAWTLLSVIILIVALRWRKRSQPNVEDPKSVAKSTSSKRTFGYRCQYLEGDNMEGFESERPVIFTFEEIEEATNCFDETRKIGVGGFGSVYFAILRKQEVAIKQMKSSKSKEFFAELKVLCKIHHINVLLGYASGDDNLCLVYEYVRNGSLSSHLHDPLLKGHQPLSWTARTQIALDTAKGIEYIHDHTKARYVHRDIKTSNILLNDGFRAKVADFGLAKLVGQTSDEDFLVTRLVGTPGYLPPESLKELQVTPKTDVFAFGVVLAELITGKRALVIDNGEPNKMKSLINVIKSIFQDEYPEVALELVIDGNLYRSYPLEDIYKMAELADWCLSENPIDRPEMRHVVVSLSQIVMSSVEWEASLGGNSQVFSGLFNGR